MMSFARHGAGLVCALTLTFGPPASTGSAGLWGWHSPYGGYGYGAAYSYGYYAAPAVYSAGYGYGGGYGGCCLTNLFSGCGLFGCARPAYGCYSPTCYSIPACGTCCDPCCGGAGGCGVGGLCYGDGCTSDDCGISGGGGTNSPYSPVPAIGGGSPPAPSSVPNRTYREDDPIEPDNPFMEPEPLDGDGSRGGSSILPPTNDASPSTPSDSDIERGEGLQFNLKIPAKDRPEAEPATEEESSDEESVDESQLAVPLELESQVVYRVQTERRRSHYRAVFRTPTVARLDVPMNDGWIPIDDGAQLAANR